MTASVALLNRGPFHNECLQYYPFHLSNRPLLNKLYDPNVLESGWYEARELSYLTDHVDCRFIDFCIRHGVAHFSSCIFFLTCFLIAATVWFFCVNDLALDWITGTEMVLIFWTASYVILMSYFLRTAKFGATLCLILMLVTIWRFFRDCQTAQLRGNLKRIFLCAIFAAAACLFDRQGVFWVGVLYLLVAVESLACRKVAGWWLVGVLTGVIGLFVFYNFVIGPSLILRLNGYPADFTAQTMPWADLWATPWVFAKRGLLLFLQSVRLICGNISFIHTALLVGGIAWILGCRTAGDDPVSPALPWWRTGTIFIHRWHFTLIICPAMIAMYMLGSLRHPTWQNQYHRTHYYWVLVGVLVLFYICLSVQKIITRGVIPRRWVQWALAVMILGNIAAIPGHQAVMKEGFLSLRFAWTDKLLDALEHLGQSDYPIDLSIRRDRLYRIYKDNVNLADIQPIPSAMVLDYEHVRLEVPSVQAIPSVSAYVPSTTNDPGSANIVDSRSATTDEQRHEIIIHDAAGSPHRFHRQNFSISGATLVLVHVLVENVSDSTVYFQGQGLQLVNQMGAPLPLMAFGVGMVPFMKASEYEKQTALAAPLALRSQSAMPLTFVYLLTSPNDRLQQVLFHEFYSIEETRRPSK